MILVSSGQSLFDVAIQELGDVAAVFELADANNLAITDPLPAGLQLLVPDSVLGRPKVVNYFAGRRINTRNTLAAAPAERILNYFHSDFFNLQYFK